MGKFMSEIDRSMNTAWELNNMAYYSMCPICKIRSANEIHHLFSQTKWAKKKYGKLIHHSNNLIYLCSSCHKNGVIPKQSEQEFIKNCITGVKND